MILELLLIGRCPSHSLEAVTHFRRMVHELLGRLHAAGQEIGDGAIDLQHPHTSR